MFGRGPRRAAERSARRGTLPAALTDEQFWHLSTSFSEPAGAFPHSDNLVSNETHFVHAVRMLHPMEGVYIGVGPEQNFSYIAKLRPAMAFILDIRQENRSLHLMYKALFEMSADRADFVSRLFSRERPAGLGPRRACRIFLPRLRREPASRLFEATPGCPRAAARRTWVSAVGRGYGGIKAALRRFLFGGSRHSLRRSLGRGPDPTYRLADDRDGRPGQSGSYLATEGRFPFLRELQART